MPSPGIYNPQNDLSPNGKYVLSKNKSAGKRTFMDGRRQSFIDLTVKRASSNLLIMQHLGLAAIDRPLISGIMITNINAT